MSDSSIFAFDDPADAQRLWFRDPLHAPRALPPLNAAFWGRFSGLANRLEPRTIHGFVYFSPLSVPRTVPAPLPHGQAAENWRNVYLPAVERAYEAILAPDYAALTALELATLFADQLAQAVPAMANTIVAAVELSPDAERLANLLESRLGDEGPLLSATILHGGDSETASLGRGVRQLADAARDSAGVPTLLAESRFEAALASTAEPWAGALRSFLSDHTDEIALWSEIHLPAWNEDPVPLLRLVAATLNSPERDASTSAEDAVATVRARLAPEDIPEFEAALALSRDYVPVIEHRARWQLKLLGSFRRPLLALGGKLVALGVVAVPDDVFFLNPDELERAAAGEDMRSRVSGRRAQWQEDLALDPPLLLGVPVPWEMLGALDPMLKRIFGAVRVAAPSQAVVTGIAASKGLARGPARVVRSLGEAEDLQDGDVLVCITTSPPWTPYFAVVSAVVTDSGGVLSHAAIEAREYGIPAVVGTRDATRRIPEGAIVTVDGAAGTVTIEG